MEAHFAIGGDGAWCPRPAQARVTPMMSQDSHIFLAKSEEMKTSGAEETKCVCSGEFS